MNHLLSDFPDVEGPLRRPGRVPRASHPAPDSRVPEERRTPALVCVMSKAPRSALRSGPAPPRPDLPGPDRPPLSPTLSSATSPPHPCTPSLLLPSTLRPGWFSSSTSDSATNVASATTATSNTVGADGGSTDSTSTSWTRGGSASALILTRAGGTRGTGGAARHLWDSEVEGGASPGARGRARAPGGGESRGGGPSTESAAGTSPRWV